MVTNESKVTQLLLLFIKMTVYVNIKDYLNIFYSKLLYLINLYRYVRFDGEKFVAIKEM